MNTSETNSGLDGITVADTRLSDVDGERGRLIVGGHDIEAIAGQVSFEAVAHLLWQGALPGPAEEARFAAALGEARARAFELLPALGGALDVPDGMDALRAAASHLAASGEPLAEAALAIGALAVFAAAWARKRAGLAPLPPDPARRHAADYLRMIVGGEPKETHARALDSYLVTVADHGLNASTFAARVVASTGSDLFSAVVAALGALKGPLHGGAPGPVLDMLDAIGAPGNAVAWLEGELRAGRRIMGMGHRIYRVRDPRAAVLERAAAELSAAGGGGTRLQLARAVERAAVDVLRAKYPDRPLLANVEFATAVLLDAVGLDRKSFTPTFAVGRVAGWVAHVKEQRATGRLIRPASRYVGPRPS
jgi:citrate synthase